MKQKKAIIFFIVCVMVLLVGLAIFIFLRDTSTLYPTEYQEHESTDTVVYKEQEYRYNEHLSNFLFMGIDTDSNDATTSGRADAIFLISYDRLQKTATCISIPRDTIANVTMIAPDGSDLGTSKEHINMQYLFGDGKHFSCRLMKDTVSNLLYDIPIQGYCSMGLDGITAAIEALGSVDVIVPDDSLVLSYPEFAKGTKVTITKENAEIFVRYRDTTVHQSALDRTNRQKVLLEAIVSQLKNKSTENTDYIVDLYEGLKPYLVTNIGNDVLLELAEANFANTNGIMDIPGTAVVGELHDEYHVDELALYEFVLDIFYKEM